MLIPVRSRGRESAIDAISVADACRGVHKREVTMVRLKLLGKHRVWEDWAGLGLGVVIGLSPWLAGETPSQNIVLHTALIGVLVMALSALELVDLRRWQEIAQLALGLWLIAAPFALDYAGTGQLAIWHFVLGGLVALLALLEVWQDWALSRSDLAKHGQ
jgi:hypothetical protein